MTEAAKNAETAKPLHGEIDWKSAVWAEPHDDISPFIFGRSEQGCIIPLGIIPRGGTEMSDETQEKKSPVIPKPILDDREYKELDKLSERYKKLTSPGPIQRAAGQVAAIVPAGVKDAVVVIGNTVAEQEMYTQALKYMADGFKVLEEQAARVTVSEDSVVKNINAVSKATDIENLEEVCRIRSYDVAKAANRNYTQHILAALAEGGGTGVAGFAGIPANLVLSTFIYYRAVQSIAMSYGYDVKNDPDELVIASDVFAHALSPTSNGTSSNVAKFMAISAAEGVKQTARKSWAAMIERGGPALLLAQMRALAHTSARKALENAGKKGLENNIFREIFEQVGKRLTLRAIQRAVPVVSAGIGALIDTAQMNTVIQYADIFYHKRFLIEKEERVRLLFGVGVEAEPAQDVEIDTMDDDFVEAQVDDDSKDASAFDAEEDEGTE